MTTRLKNDKDSTNSTVYNSIEEKEFCVDCYTELHYYHVIS
jgi:hypothetical protein